ncbi:hypothetical protein SLEP1_g14679 [Rubroshorea leprosula]|uniref:AAA+ ATPase domain-containing protein n=1 Tax=Rubroshorea leprosula TaxID=152421 RepID=A0AAV5ITR6_9ROSI|nr:hypothetical protein SLEP1_g14679 [Rubroshorea leprosula]
MAETILITPIIQDALKNVISFAADKAFSFAVEQICLAWGFKQELANLEDSLLTIQDVLQDAEEKQESDPAVRRWLQKLRDVAYDAVDVLDECAYKLLQLKVETQGRLTKQVCMFFSGTNSIMFRLKMAKKIKKINESLVKVKGDAVFPLLTRNKRAQFGRFRPDTDSYIESKVEGRDKEVLEIVNLLTALRGQHPISVISLIGMAGIGKTTLAKLLCKEIEKKNIFDVVAWVCVSDDFDERKILKGVLEYLDQNAGGIDNIDVLLKRLEEKLEKKTFLLVLDDVWNEDSNTWANFVNRVLKIMKTSGNSIFVTTRNERVASSLAKFLPLHEHHVQKLPEDDCWLIIKEKVFGSATSSISDQHLEAIGRDIAKNCGGLPLIASVLGGTMRVVRGVDEWLSIKESNVWNSEDGNQVLRILKLSFDHLPSHLKKCFSYCSIFPKDFDIKKDDLVQLWMAQGFLYPSSEETMEDIGNKYFNDLLSNSLFQDVERDKYGNIQTCKIHDVVHDLAVFVSKNETLILKNGSIGENSCIRHLRVLSGAPVDPTILRGVAPKLHSLFSEVDFCNLSLDLKSIRSLSLKAADVDQLPASLGKLKHLRYLDVSGTKIKALPKSFTRLKFYLDKSNPASSSHGGGELITLFPALKELRICEMDNLEEWAEIEEMVVFPRLEILQIEFCSRLKTWSMAGELSGGVPWTPHPLKLLKMGPFYSELEEFPGLTSIHPLHTSLETLQLYGWDKVKSLPHQLQHLTTLKELELWNFNGLEALQEGLGNLSSLASLRIENCNKLKSIPENIGELRSLTVLEIINCKELRSFPEECLGRLTHLKELRVGPFWSELEEFPGFASVGHLHTSLEILEIRGWDKLKSLPQQLQYLTTLRELWLLSFGSLEALPEWFQNLSSLQDLRIRYCPNLMHLPSVEAMRHLSNLQILYIEYCPKLKERCAIESGPEWSKISQIPDIGFW